MKVRIICVFIAYIYFNKFIRFFCKFKAKQLRLVENYYINCCVCNANRKKVFLKNSYKQLQML